MANLSSNVAQSNLLLTTKLYIPPTPSELVSRPRLVEGLDAGLVRKLTLVSAPAGFGKTTLVSQWLSGLDRPLSWLSLDQGDNDLARCLNYIIAALQRIDANLGQMTQAFLQAPQLPAIGALLTPLINEITALDTPFVLVLDDYHVITLPTVHEAITFLLEYIPENVHLVIATREDPPLPLGRLRAQRQMTEIRAGDLRFTEEEAAAFLNQAMGLNLPPEAIRALETRTEGWIIGLQLAALSIQGEPSERVSGFVQAFTGSHRYIVDYLTEEVLRRRPPGTRSFLLETSILDRLTGRLCDDVTGQRDGQATLERLEKANLFLVPLDNERGWYRYHHLFAELLHNQLVASHPELVPTLHRRARVWYEQNGFITDAVSHALAAEDFEEAARLVEQIAKQMLEHSQLAQLMQAVDALPNENVRALPWLCVFHAWALRLSGAGFEAVESRLLDAEQALGKYGGLPQAGLVEGSTFPEEEIPKLRGHIAALRAYQALYKEEILRVIELAHQALEYGPEGDFVRSSIALALGWAYRFSGDLVAASQAFGEAKTIGLMSGNIYLAVAATCRDAHGLVLGGKLHQAVERYQEALQITTIKGRSRLPVAGYAFVYLGGVYCEWNDLETATRCLVEGIDLCVQVGYIMDQVVGQVNLARVKAAQRDFDGAQDACLEAEQLSQRMKGYVYVRRWVEDCQVRLWLAQGNLDAAAQWAQASELRVDDELDFKRELEHIILARVLVALGRAQPEGPHLEDALKLLARLLEAAETAGWMGKAIEILVLQALAFEAKGQNKEALAALERALSLAEPQGYVRIFIDEGAFMAALISKLLEAQWKGREVAGGGIAPVYVDKLLAAFDIETKDDVHTTSSLILGPSSFLVEPLSARELEVLRLLNTDLSAPEIAAELVISVNTVRTHIKRIYSKLDAHSRYQAVERAKKLDLL